MASRRKQRLRRDPDQRCLATGRLVLYVVGGGHLWMGFAMRGQGSGFSDGFGGYKSIVFGTVVLACAIWAHWRRTPTPYWVVVVLFVLDLALTLYISPRWSDLLLVVGGTMRVLFGYYVVCAAISAGNLARRNRDGGVDDGGGRTEP